MEMGGGDHRRRQDDRARHRFHLGRAAAVAWAMFLIILIFVVVNTLLARRIRSAS